VKVNGVSLALASHEERGLMGPASLKRIIDKREPYLDIWNRFFTRTGSRSPSLVGGAHVDWYSVELFIGDLPFTALFYTWIKK